MSRYGLRKALKSRRRLRSGQADSGPGAPCRYPDPQCIRAAGAVDQQDVAFSDSVEPVLCATAAIGLPSRQLQHDRHALGGPLRGSS